MEGTDYYGLLKLKIPSHENTQNPTLKKGVKLI
jgi:hypothetical protein